MSTWTLSRSLIAPVKVSKATNKTKMSNRKAAKVKSQVKRASPILRTRRSTMRMIRECKTLVVKKTLLMATATWKTLRFRPHSKVLTC